MTMLGDGLSRELQIGKAGEHLVCADLILQGFNAFISDQGLPYDVVVDRGGQLLRVQVKTTLDLVADGDGKRVLRFGIRSGRHQRGVGPFMFDWIAFVWLRRKSIAYLPVTRMSSRQGSPIKRLVEFRTRELQYHARVYGNGRVSKIEWGQRFEDFGRFGVEPAPPQRQSRRCEWVSASGQACDRSTTNQPLCDCHAQRQRRGIPMDLPMRPYKPHRRKEANGG